MPIFCCRNNPCCQDRQIINRNNYITGPTGPAGPAGATGATGPTGPTGPTGSGNLFVSLNQNNVEQTVSNDEMVSFTGTNYLSPDSDMFFSNNFVTLNSPGIYQVTCSLEVATENDTFEFTITAGGNDYSFYVTVSDSKLTGTTSHTVILNVINTPINVAVYNRNGGSIDLDYAELDVVKLSN